MAVEPDSAGVRFPPPLVYLGALLLGLTAEPFVTLRSFGIDWRLLVATGALLFVAGAAVMLAGSFHETGWLDTRFGQGGFPSECHAPAHGDY